MERNDTDVERSLESGAAGPTPRATDDTAPPLTIRSGALGAVVAIAVSALLVLALWTIARNAPSAATDPRLIPPPAATPSSERAVDQLYLTIVPTESRLRLAAQRTQRP